MKILVDLVRVRQEWNPDTNVQTNSMILVFAGKQFEIEATTEEIETAIAHAVLGREEVRRKYVPEAAPSEFPNDGLSEALDAEASDGTDDQVFGGDYDEDQPVSAPAMFQTNAAEPEEESPSLEDLIQPEAPPEAVFIFTGGKVLKPADIKQLTVARRQALVAKTKMALDAKDPSTTRAFNKHQLRLRAQAVPPRTVPRDEAGNPVVPQRRAGQLAARQSQHGQPEVVVTSSTEPSDDDGFAQG